MPKATMRLLREAVRSEISNSFEMFGHAKPREVAQVVCALHREDVLRIGERLAENALTDIARRELKRKPSATERAQLQLPGIPDALQAFLPPAISIPPPGVDVESLDEDGVIYKPLSQATLTDIDAHLVLLSAQIKADTRRHRALRELRDLAIAAGADAHEPLLTTLQHLNPQEDLS